MSKLDCRPNQLPQTPCTLELRTLTFAQCSQLQLGSLCVPQKKGSAACFPPVRPRARPRRRRHAAPSLAERRRARAQLLYWTFLAEALPAGGSEPGLDALYYSEMHEAGYFDAGDDLG